MFGRGLILKRPLVVIRVLSVPIYCWLVFYSTKSCHAITLWSQPVQAALNWTTFPLFFSSRLNNASKARRFSSM